MIVFLDMEKQEIKLYSDEGCKTIPFYQSDMLRVLAGKGTPIIYVTQALETTSESVCELVDKISNKNSSNKENSSNKVSVNKKPSVLYVRSPKSSVHIPDINLTLDGANDFMPLSKLFAKYGENILQEHQILSQLLKNGKIEIVDQGEIDLYWKKKQKEQEAKDKQLDSLIVDKRVEDYLDGDSMDSDAIEIDLESTSFGGGGELNEGGLLPSDF